MCVRGVSFSFRQAVEALVEYRTGQPHVAALQARSALALVRDPKYSLLEAYANLAEVFCGALNRPDLEGDVEALRPRLLKAAHTAVEQLGRLAGMVPVAAPRHLIYKAVLLYGAPSCTAQRVLQNRYTALPHARPCRSQVRSNPSAPARARRRRRCDAPFNSGFSTRRSPGGGTIAVSDWHASRSHVHGAIGAAGGRHGV